MFAKGCLSEVGVRQIDNTLEVVQAKLETFSGDRKFASFTPGSNVGRSSIVPKHVFKATGGGLGSSKTTFDI